MDSTKGYFQRLKDKWGLNSVYQVVVILFVFALTGTTVMLLKKPILNYFSNSSEDNIIFSVIYYILILPLYNIILLFYGAIFGKFSFFWEFEKRFIKRIFKSNNLNK